MSSMNQIFQRLINYKTLNQVLHQYTEIKIIDRKTFNLTFNNFSMKRSKTIHSVNNKINPNENDTSETVMMIPETKQNLPQSKDKQIKRSKINLKVLRNKNDKSLETIKLQDFEGKKEIIEISDTDKNVTRKKIRAIVDLEMMKDELKQLEDPPVTPLEKEICSSRLPFEFYDTPCEDLAQNLLGKVLVRRLENGTILKGRIVETEGYLGEIDKASHAYQNKVTPRNIPMYMSPGTIYIYMTYGMYYCFNISSKGDGSAVLIRAVEPLEGMEYMTSQRIMKKKSNMSKGTIKDFKVHELCNGPSKLCMSFQLNKNHNKYSLCEWKGLWIEDDSYQEEIKIIQCARIGIDSCGPEWSRKPLRYYIYGNKSVSKRDKKAEALIINT
ncbi:PREDICTED: DNA-3-methyladenine glycosylase-like isoform X2 [Polistes dominula]|uniref:DNA-3-methyladenine glycosylase II n=1 Tax=Polistes dominula TaxID=743375 RepID=A0ABM1HVY2_POLDO|nr:PREDICTED: DNA-3-methyladenine glycosylase-like isoform X2 [Polistes dominula]